MLKDAVVAAEDRNFYSHGGVDLRGTLRALWTDLRSGERRAGRLDDHPAVRAAGLRGGRHRAHDRPQDPRGDPRQPARPPGRQGRDPLPLPVDTIYFGEGAYGVGAAAQTYFRKPARDLTLSEAALLAGVIPAPTAYSPRDNPESAETQAADRARRHARGRATSRRSSTPTPSAEHRSGSPGVGDAARRRRHTFVLPARGRSSRASRGSPTTCAGGSRATCSTAASPGDCPPLTRGGLTIETTLDPRVAGRRRGRGRPAARGHRPDARRWRSSRSSRPPASCGPWSAAATSPQPGEHRARRDGGGTTGGSAFKPFVLAEAFEQGIQPDAVVLGRAPRRHEACGRSRSTTTAAPATARMEPALGDDGTRSTPCSPA